MGGLNNRNYFSQLWRLRSPRSTCLLIWFPVRVLFLVVRAWPSKYRSSTWLRERRLISLLCDSFLLMTLILSDQGPTFKTSFKLTYLHKDSYLQIQSHWGLAVQHRNLKSIHSVHNICKSIFIFAKNCQTLPKWLYHFAPAMNESSCSFTSLSAFGVVSILYFDHSNRCVVISHCCYISLMTYDVGHLFVCLFAISISLARCLLRCLAC